MFEALFSALGGGGGATAAGADSADIGAALGASGGSAGGLSWLDKLVGDPKLNMLISLGSQLGGAIAGKDTVPGQISAGLANMAQSNIMAAKQGERENKQNSMMKLLSEALAGKFTPAGTPGPTQLTIGADGFKLKADPNKAEGLTSIAQPIVPDAPDQITDEWTKQFSSRLDNMLQGF